MPAAHFSKVFGTQDAKVAKVTDDPSGGSVTYAASVDVPAIKSVEISGDVNTVELRGDNSLLDSATTLTNISAAVTHGKLSLDVLGVLLGPTVVDSGTGTTEVATFDLTATSALNYFKLEAATPSTGSDFVGGDVHFVLHKCIINGFPDIGTAEEDYRTSSFGVAAVPLLATGRKWLSIVFNETAAAIT